MSKKVAFTICANNYLAHATVLAKSFKKYHPDIDFVTCIVDKKNPNVNYANRGNDEYIWIDETFNERFSELEERYHIAELCTAVKPKVFLRLSEAGYEQIIYLDPDIQVFGTFEEVFEALLKHDMVLTPHMCSPTSMKDVYFDDKQLLKYGTFNLGFLAVTANPDILTFMKWWDDRLVLWASSDTKKNLFYDQLWMNLAPSFIDNYFVLKHKGYNVATWNLHERKILKKDKELYVNSESKPLKFYHFSHFKESALPRIASNNPDFTTENRADISNILSKYLSSLKQADIDSLKGIEHIFGHIKDARPSQSNKVSTAISYFKKGVKTLIS